MLQQEAKGAPENAAALNTERSGEYGCDKQPSLYMSIIFILINLPPHRQEFINFG